MSTATYEDLEEEVLQSCEVLGAGSEAGIIDKTAASRLAEAWTGATWLLNKEKMRNTQQLVVRYANLHKMLTEERCFFQQRSAVDGCLAVLAKAADQPVEPSPPKKAKPTLTQSSLSKHVVATTTLGGQTVQVHTTHDVPRSHLSLSGEGLAHQSDAQQQEATEVRRWDHRGPVARVL